MIDIIILAMFCVKGTSKGVGGSGGGDCNKMPFGTNKYKLGTRGVASLKLQHDCKGNLE